MSAKYFFYIEGLNMEFSVVAYDEWSAREQLWRSLSEDQKNAVVSIECVDIED